MSKLNNVVIGGSFQGQRIKTSKYGMFIGDIQINKETIDHFEIMNENANTISVTKGKSKKSMIGSGTKGAVGAAVGSMIAPGIGTLIGAGAGVTSGKRKNKSVTKEITTKEVIVAIYFKNGEQSIVKMDGDHYETFLGRTFSNPVSIPTKKPKQKREKQQKDKESNYIFFKSIGWLFVPYIMLPIFWNKLANKYRIAGSIWTAIAIMEIIINGIK